MISCGKIDVETAITRRPVSAFYPCRQGQNTLWGLGCAVPSTTDKAIMSDLIHEFILHSAQRTPAAEALVHGKERLDYATLASAVRAAGGALLAAGLGRGERVAVYLEKRIENVVGMFGAAVAGGVFVPVNPLLKPEQVAYILADCNVKVLLTSVDRFKLLQGALSLCPDLGTVMLVGGGEAPSVPGLRVLRWDDAIADARSARRSVPRIVPSIPIWPPFCTPPAARANPRVSFCRTGTWWRARTALPVIWKTRRPTAFWPCCP